MSKLEVITNFYSNKVSFCKYSPQVQQITILLFDCKNYSKKQDRIECSFHARLFKVWPLNYHNSGAFRTGIGVVAHSSHNTVTTMTPSIHIFNQLVSGRVSKVRIIWCHHGSQSSLQNHYRKTPCWNRNLWLSLILSLKKTGVKTFNLQNNAVIFVFSKTSQLSCIHFFSSFKNVGCVFSKTLKVLGLFLTG